MPIPSGSPSRRRILGALCIALCALASCTGDLARRGESARRPEAASGGAVIELDHADLWMGSERPEPVDSGSRSSSHSSALAPPVHVELPDTWRLSRRRRATEGWYRMQLSLEARPSESWAVHLPRVSLNAALFVNDHRIGDAGSLEVPVARNWNRPLLFEIPDGVLRAGTNVIEVHLVTTLTSLGALGPLRVGPTAQLEPQHARQHFLQIGLIRVLAIAMTGVALLLLATFAVSRDDSTIGWYAAGALLWSINMADFYVRDPLLPTRVWQWAIHTGLLGACICFSFALHRGLGLERARLERALLTLWVLAALVFATSPDRSFSFWAAISAWVGLLLMLKLSLELMRRPTPRGRLSGVALRASGAIAFALLAHDLLLFFGFGYALPLGSRILHAYLVPVGALLAGGSLARRYASALDASRALNRELEVRVEAKRSEIAAQYATLQRLESQRAVSAERERLMREMHDGVAGRLANTLALLEAQELSREDLGAGMRAALEDVRLMIDSLEPVEDLTAFLGSIRPRLQRTTAPHGLQFEWRVEDLPPVVGFRPELALEVLRILQEALTNVIRHAGAKRVRIESGAGLDPKRRPAVYVEVADDGCGIDGRHSRGRGRGLENMRSRAASLGAELEIVSRAEPDCATGTRIRLWLARAEPQSDQSYARTRPSCSAS